MYAMHMGLCVYNDRVLIKMAAVYVYILIATYQSSLYSDHAWLPCSLAKPLKVKLVEVLVV